MKSEKKTSYYCIENEIRVKKIFSKLVQEDSSSKSLQNDLGISQNSKKLPLVSLWRQELRTDKSTEYRFLGFYVFKTRLFTKKENCFATPPIDLSMWYGSIDHCHGSDDLLFTERSISFTFDRSIQRCQLIDRSKDARSIDKDQVINTFDQWSIFASNSLPKNVISCQANL